MTKIKICGISRVDDARFCAEQGVDFLGFVFVRESPRSIEPFWSAAALAAAFKAATLSPHSKTVGVFRNESPETIRRIVTEVGLDYVQLHGSETDDDIAEIGMPAIKAFHVAESLPDTTSSAEWLMFDSGGGTGRTFDWSLLAGYPRTKPFFLAGGITPDNVAEAIRAVRPDAIDVSSGVELEPGVKDFRKIRALLERVRA